LKTHNEETGSLTPNKSNWCQLRCK